MRLALPRQRLRHDEHNMTLRPLKNYLAVLLLLLVSSFGAAQRYSQIVIPFSNEKRFDYTFIEEENALSIDLLNTSPEELAPIYNYDDRLVKRLIVREHSNKNTQIKLVLRDKNIKAALYSFTEPDRLVIDLYDDNFQEKNDPNTGLPVVKSTSHPRVQKASRNRPNSYPGQAALSLSSKANSKAPTNNYKSQTGKRRLLQPKPDDINNSEELVLAMEKVNPGVGTAWKTYPKYIYRFPTSSLKSGKNYKSWLKKNANRALSSGESLANYAAQMYDFGHELKSLIAYQKVLHEEPLVFDKNAKHIWNLAEIHLGQKNLTLADGYYQSLIDKHPDSPFAQHAKLRKLDIKAIAYSAKNDVKGIEDLNGTKDLINTNGLPELAAQIALRQAYWNPTFAVSNTSLKKNDLPKCDKESSNKIRNNLNRAENPKTAFLMNSILLKEELSDGSWSPADLKESVQYFKKYKGRSAEPYRSELIAKASENLSNKITKLGKEGKSLETIKTYEDVPKTLLSDINSFDLAWSIAESYKDIQRPKDASKFYEKAFEMAPDKKSEFRAKINLLNSLKDSLDLDIASNNTANSTKTSSQLAIEDRKLLQLWNSLTDQQKLQMTVQFSDFISDNLDRSHPSQAESIIQLWSWNKSILSNIDGKCFNVMTNMYNNF